jgi:hypothetical protein
MSHELAMAKVQNQFQRRAQWLACGLSSLAQAVTVLEAASPDARERLHFADRAGSRAGSTANGLQQLIVDDATTTGSPSKPHMRRGILHLTFHWPAWQALRSGLPTPYATGKLCRQREDLITRYTGPRG